MQGNSLTINTGNGLFSGIPTEEQLLAWGFEEYTPPEREPKTQDNPSTETPEQRYVYKVRELIGEKYAIEDELAIQRQRDTDPEKFNEYFAYCEECKARAREALGMPEETAATISLYSETTPISPRSKKLSIQAGKQYYNEMPNRVVTSYEGFSPANPTATILSSSPLSFEGNNVLTPVEIPDSEYLLYNIEYVQTSDIKFILVVSVTAMKAPDGGLKGEDIPVMAKPNEE